MPVEGVVWDGDAEPRDGWRGTVAAPSSLVLGCPGHQGAVLLAMGGSQGAGDKPGGQQVTRCGMVPGVYPRSLIFQRSIILLC